MKNMKFGFLGALAIAGGMFFAGCSDPCKDVACVNGECTDGDCICNTGYEGLDCSTAINAKFSGAYSLSETCNPSGAATYSVTVAPKSGTTDEVSFTGLWEEPQAIVTAHVGTDGTSFHIERQALGTSGFDIEATTGSISADGNTINISYTIYATGSSTAADACSGSMTK